MKKEDIKKVVLAYSGGLDTSIIIPWLKENYNNCEVIAVSADVGQGTELDGLEEKAIKTGASKLYVLDLKKEFIEDFIYPTMQAGAVYEGDYLLGTSFARPIIAQKIVEIALKEGADAIAHGCTGKGNDQVRFELTIKAFAPEMAIIAPWREWTIKSREEEIDYAEAHNVPLKINRETNYSKDKNLWHLSHEGLDLEDIGILRFFLYAYRQGFRICKNTRFRLCFIRIYQCIVALFIGTEATIHARNGKSVGIKHLQACFPQFSTIVIIRLCIKCRIGSPNQSVGQSVFTVSKRIYVKTNVVYLGFFPRHRSTV